MPCPRLEVREPVYFEIDIASLGALVDSAACPRIDGAQNRTSVKKQR
jgi:hypothetical protein